MLEPITASVIDLSNFKFPGRLITYGPLFDLWKVGVSDQESYAVKTYHVARRGDEPLGAEDTARNFKYFLREVSNLLYAWHPMIVPIIG
jgi:hypothetical protein